MGHHPPWLEVYGEAAMDDRQRAPRKHVFAVNSSPDFLLIIRELLEGEGYAVTTNDFTPNVFTQIVMRQPDALIVDIAPGESTGWDLLRRLHTEAATTGIPLLVTSTSSALLEQVHEQATWYGTKRSFLTKPMDLDDLLAIVREMIGDGF
jgi:CheY-like chemotaxis protein